MSNLLKLNTILQNSAEARIYINIPMTIEVKLLLYLLLLIFMFYLSGLVPSFFYVSEMLSSLLKYHISFVAVVEGKVFLDAG